MMCAAAEARGASGHLALLAAAVGMIFWFAKLPEAIVTAMAAGILYLATTGKLPFLNWRPLLWLGFISYPLYLTHQNMGFILLHQLDLAGWNPYLASGLVTMLAIGVAASSPTAWNIPSCAACAAS